MDAIAANSINAATEQKLWRTIIQKVVVQPGHLLDFQIISEEIRKVLGLDSDDVSLHSSVEYEADSANNIFTEDMATMLQGRTTPVVLMFDEIEAITFGVGKETGPWYDGDSFIHFWNVLRGFVPEADLIYPSVLQAQIR